MAMLRICGIQVTLGCHVVSRAPTTRSPGVEGAADNLTASDADWKGHRLRGWLQWCSWQSSVITMACRSQAILPQRMYGLLTIRMLAYVLGVQEATPTWGSSSPIKHIN